MLDTPHDKARVRRHQNMRPREVLARSHTPDGQVLELTRESSNYVIRVGGIILMTSATYGSEQQMARIARQVLGERENPRVLVGGLGMGYTLRAVLDQFGSDLQVTVAELLSAVVAFSRDILGHIADHPLDDPRTQLFEGDVRHAIDEGSWDAILLDVDNGPDALTTRGNAGLYGSEALDHIRRALNPGGVFILWSTGPNREFEARVRRAGLSCEVHNVRARGLVRKGARHVLFVARAPR
jgi:spermidine synthase